MHRNVLRAASKKGPGLKIFKGFFLSLCVLFTLFMVGIKGTKKVRRYYSEKINASLAPVKKSDVSGEKPFVVIIPSYNNEEFCEKNLRSIFAQNYDNYRIIYIDDASEDKTAEVARRVVRECGEEERSTVIRNPENKKMLYNIYYAIHCCRDDEIIFVVDGDDWLSHPNVLKKLNRYYQNENVWLTYGTYITYPRYERGLSKVSDRHWLKKGKLRKKGPWLYSQPRTFYAGLFKSIHLKDLIDPKTGAFYPSSGDVAIMFPMLEMAREHTAYIPDILYVYNRDTPINDDKIRNTEQKQLEKEIRQRDIYAALKQKPVEKSKFSGKVEIVVTSQNNPAQLLACIESIKKNVAHAKKIYVFYSADKPSFQRGYQTVKEYLEDMDIDWRPWIEKNKTPNPSSIYEQINTKAEYLALFSDKVIVQRPVNLSKQAKALDKMGADQSVLSMSLKTLEKKYPIKERVLVSTGSSQFVFSVEGVDHLTQLAEAVIIKRQQGESSYSKFFPRLSRFMAQKRCRIWALSTTTPAVVETKRPKFSSAEGKMVSIYSEEELNQHLLEGQKIDIEAICEANKGVDQIDLYPRFVAL